MYIQEISYQNIFSQKKKECIVDWQTRSGDAVPRNIENNVIMLW